MIIQCQQCGSRFKLDEGLLREEGSKVRCSLCKVVFMAYPPGAGAGTGETRTEANQTLGETVTLDTPPTLDEPRQEEPLLEDTFEAELAKALQEESETKRIEAVSPDQIPEEEEEELRFDFEEGIKGAEVQRETGRKPQAPQKPEKAVPKKVKKGGVPKFLMIVLIIILLITGAVAALLYFAPEYVPDSLTSYVGVAEKTEVKDPGVRRLSFEAVTGKFHPSSKAGNLFCIQGTIVNGYPRSRSFIRVKGSLLDEKGLAVRQKVVFAGNTFTESELKDMTLEQITEGLANRAGKGNANVNVKAQGSVPFMIVFDNLPDNLSEFTVEAISSIPGQ